MEVRTEFSVISRGTEQYSKKGYMSISYPENGFRYIQDVDHGVLKSKVNDHSLKVNDFYSIENIVFSRFQLIPELLFSRINFSDHILLCGLGNLGYATLISLIDRGFKNISILVKESNYLFQILDKNNKIKLVSDITGDYNTYIDTSGSSTVIKDIFDTCKSMSNIIILSTPKDKEYLIDPVIINRKNLLIYGGHELNGYTQKYRNIVLNELLEKNKFKDFNYLMSFNDYDTYVIDRLRNKKNKIYDIIKY